ncbi:DUF1214 domain-containing protein [Microbacterium sp. CFBP9034]|uniref:DUF1214 domain-containing protein n=1 Tax=Microbacterium sp. CFBP9034 TaxID=3096540 RepID=UPI002A6B86D0|nr:DUF1214 domain-containing protein [Microbacterium sp. CFBP9034]MDY0908054.1 DUF1214 domain-containing protein [Microbacterium sp. CFBP9034]
MTIHVNADNFVRAETDRMFGDIQRDAGGVNTFRHSREPASIDAQTVIRLNRDTLYSFAIVDLSEGGSIVVPDAGDRYLSVMIVDHDHYVRAVIHDAGTYDLAEHAPGADYVLVAARTLVDPDEPDDLAVVAAIQDGLLLEVGSAVEFESPEYDTASLDATRTALLALAAGLRSFDRTFGTPEEVDPVRHLIGTAAGWGGLPVTEASYVGVDPQLPVAFYDLTMNDVPVDAFWSVSVYNASGYFEPNAENRYSVNSVTGVRDEDGSITVHFTPPGGATEPNSIPLPEGWNYLIRLYRPRSEFAEGNWHVPDLVRRRDRDAEHAPAVPEPTPEAETDAEPAAGPEGEAGAPDQGQAPDEQVGSEAGSQPGEPAEATSEAPSESSDEWPPAPEGEQRTD